MSVWHGSCASKGRLKLQRTFIRMNQIQLRLLRSSVHEICLLHNKRALFRLNRQNPCDKKRHTTAQLKLCQPPPVGTQHSCSLSASKAPEILVADTVEQEAQMSHRKSLPACGHLSMDWCTGNYGLYPPIGGFLSIFRWTRILGDLASVKRPAGEKIHDPYDGSRLNEKRPHPMATVAWPMVSLLRGSPCRERPAVVYKVLVSLRHCEPHSTTQAQKWHPS